MGTKTISIADDAYERLNAAKREGESFSDVVRRLAPGVRLADYVGVLDEETGDELEETIMARRTEKVNDRRARRRRIVEALDDE
jgi:predicted CopG family antitoxin